MIRPVPMTLADCPPARLRQALGAEGLWLDLGALTVRLRDQSGRADAALQRAYRHFPVVAAAEWADVHLRLHPGAGLRRWLRPQVQLAADGHTPFEPFPAVNALALFEWGCNWLVGQRTTDLLLLHAGAVERDGLALVMPALPGSGKSTLTAALSLSGWRLLSDEFGAFDPQAGCFRALLKPVALKNQSIDVISAFSREAHFGPRCEGTRKGTVAHLAATADAVARRAEPARPGAFVLPRWVAGSPVRLTPLAAERLFPALAFNAFNYGMLGETGYDAVLGLVRRCPAWSLEYGHLPEALAALDALWPDIQRAATHGAAVPARASADEAQVAT